MACCNELGKPFAFGLLYLPMLFCRRCLPRFRIIVHGALFVDRRVLHSGAKHGNFGGKKSNAMERGKSMARRAWTLATMRIRAPFR